MTDGIVNVLKPTGMSSHDIVGQLRRIYQMKKIGHAGTLDPLAAGVLPVYLGLATRLIEYGDSDTKSYCAEFILGLATDTEDTTGQVVETKAVPPIDEATLEAVLTRFRGAIDQTPSRYSAINVNGVKAYKLARQHADFTLPVRHVQIDRLDLIGYDAASHKGWIAVTCSKGTYIRSLIRDIGEALGTCAVMSYLVRTAAGQFDIDDAATLEELEKAPMDYVLPVDSAIGDMKRANLNDKQCAWLLQGRPVPFAGKGLAQRTILRVYGPDRQLAGIAKFDEEHHVLRPHKMFPPEWKG